MQQEASVQLRAKEIGWEWERNGEVEWNGAEELVTMVRTLPEGTLTACPPLKRILEHADTHNDWDVGYVNTWPEEVAQALETFTNRTMDRKLEQWIGQAEAEAGTIQATFLRQVLTSFRANTTRYLVTVGETDMRSAVKRLGDCTTWHEFFTQVYDLMHPVHNLAQAHQWDLNYQRQTACVSATRKMGYHLPAPGSDLLRVIDREALDAIWDGQCDAIDFEHLKPSEDPGVVSQYQYANRQGQLVLAAVFRDGTRNVLWDFGSIERRATTK